MRDKKGRIKKGSIPWNKGRKLDSLSEEHKKKISEANKGHKVSEKTRKKISEVKMGHTVSTKAREKISKSLSGKNNPMWGKHPSEKTKEKIRKTLKAKDNSDWEKRFTEKYRKKMSMSLKGEDIYNWSGFSVKKNKRIRSSKKWPKWRKAVFERDNHTCQICIKRGGRLHPHHILAFAKYPTERFSLDNGKTLCIDCHNKLHFGAGE